MAGDRLDRLLAELREEFPGFRLLRKDRCFSQRAIHWALTALTLGRMRRYLDSYQTTLGQTIYVTPDWDERSREEQYVTLRHERVHLRQFRRLTRPGMGILYLLVPLPLGLAYFRARLEWQAYRETLRACREVYGREHITRTAFRSMIIGQFLGPSYGWMWPFRRQVEAWYERALDEIS